MLGAIYISLAGMTSYSKGLDVISNNVANLNTPGFKSATPLFSDLINQHGGDAIARGTDVPPSGAGVTVDDSDFSFKQGELRDTGNPLDAAVDGNGFFVLEKDGQFTYTRAGQLEFDKDGYLVERTTGAKVMTSNGSSGLQPFNLNDYRSFAPKVTSEVKLNGVLARTGTTTTYDLAKIKLVDTTGATQEVTGKFVRDGSNPLLWTLEVRDSDGTVLGSGQLQFNADGTPASGSNSVAITIKPKESAEFAVTFTLGDPNTYAGVTSIADSSQSQVQVLKQDGIKLGTLSQMSFDEKGQLQLTYSNGETKQGNSLVLAQFDTPDQLRVLGGGMFAATSTASPRLATALNGGLGRVVGGKVELSNVQLTDQFTDLIIIQRGYQASSQVSSVANEMIQQLLAMSGQR